MDEIDQETRDALLRDVLIAAETRLEGTGLGLQSRINLIRELLDEMYELAESVMAEPPDPVH
jgi:hypothetical protein